MGRIGRSHGSFSTEVRTLTFSIAYRSRVGGLDWCCLNCDRWGGGLLRSLRSRLSCRAEAHDLPPVRIIRILLKLLCWRREEMQ